MSYLLSDSCQISNLAEIYTKYFGDDKNVGYFIEVGAYDGYGFSNVWGLAEKSRWRGICVEPVHELAERCRLVHAKNSVHVLEYAVTDVNGNAKLFLGPNEDSPLSSIWPYGTDVPGEFSRQGNGLEYDKERFVSVPAVTLDHILLDNVTVYFDLIVIDIEGAELMALKGFTWEIWKPTMIIIESNIHSTEIADWFSKTDYKLLQNDTLNSIYVLELK